MLTLRASAKINWFLRVLDRRADGYHEIETVFQEIDLADELDFEKLPSVECRIEGFPPDLPAQQNLIYKAWTLLREKHGGVVGGLKVLARKGIPAGGGLGGGSSNAATALRAANELFHLKLSAGELEQFGAQIGSDVPFFIRGGSSVGTGRGERLHAVKVTKVFWLVLVFPGMNLSTAEAYRALSATPRERMADRQVAPVLDALSMGDVSALARAIHNDFELVLQEARWFRECTAALEAAGCPRAFLSGSGSTVIGLARDENHARQVVRQLQGFLPYKAIAGRTVLGTRD